MEVTRQEVCHQQALAEAVPPAWLPCSLPSSFCPSSHCNNSPPPLSPGSRSLCSLCSQSRPREPGMKLSFDLEVCTRCAQRCSHNSSAGCSPLPRACQLRGALPPRKPQCGEVTATPVFDSRGSSVSDVSSLLRGAGTLGMPYAPAAFGQETLLGGLLEPERYIGVIQFRGALHAAPRLRVNTPLDNPRCTSNQTHNS